MVDLSAIDSLEFLGVDSFLFHDGEGPEPLPANGLPPADPPADPGVADPEVPDAALDALAVALGLDTESFLWAPSASQSTSQIAGPSAGQAVFGFDAGLAVAKGPTGEPQPEKPFISDIPGVTPVDKPHDPPVENPVFPEASGPSGQAVFGFDAGLAIPQGPIRELPPEEPFISDIPGVTPVEKPHDPPVENPIVPGNAAVSGGQTQEAVFGFDSQFLLSEGQIGEPPPEEPFISDIPGVTPVDKPHDPPVVDPVIPDTFADFDSFLFV